MDAIRDGDVISLVQDILNCTPFEAIKQLNDICGCGVDLEVDRTKPKFEYDKKFAEYKTIRKNINKFSREKKFVYENLFQAACIVFRYWYNLKLVSKDWDINYCGDMLNIIYKNVNIFENIVDLFDEDIEYIYKIKDYLKYILERGIIYMDFDNIALIAYKEEAMPKSATNVELITYYMLKELYIKHYRKQIDDNQAKLEKQKIKGYYEEQTKLDNFNQKLHKQISDNILKGENDVVKILKLINQNGEIKDICNIAINCISNLTDNSVLKKMYEEKY